MNRYKCSVLWKYQQGFFSSRIYISQNKSLGNPGNLKINIMITYVHRQFRSNNNNNNNMWNGKPIVRLQPIYLSDSICIIDYLHENKMKCPTLSVSGNRIEYFFMSSLIYLNVSNISREYDIL